MDTHRIYDVLCTFGFFLLAGGLVISKFSVTLGAVILALCSMFLFVKKIKIEWTPMHHMFPLIITYIVLIISALYSFNKIEGYREMLVQSGLFVVPVLISFHWAHFKRRLGWVVNFLFAVAVIGCVTTLFFYVIPVESAMEIVNDNSLFQKFPVLINKTQFGLYSPFIERLHFAYALSFCVLIGLYLSFLSRRWYYKVLSLFFLFMLLIIGARGAQIALLFALIPFLFFYFKDRFPKFQIFSWSSLIYSLMFLVAVPSVSYSLIPSVKNRYNQLIWELQVINDGTYKNFEYQHFTTLTRLKSFEYSLDLIRLNPILGTGIGDAKNDLKEIYQLKTPDIPAHQQNYYLFLWVAGGFGALISFIGFQWHWIKSFLRKYDHLLDRSLAISYSIFVVSILMIDAVLKYHLGVFGIPFFYMVIMAFADKNKSTMS
ncbi:MAG: O-antigen ligase family protein [Saprospiraceae bacterium]